MKLTLTRAEVQALLAADSQTTLIEALPPEYYQAGHLPGAINIPHDQIAAQAATLLPEKDTAVVVYCASASCSNSRQAAQTLRALGYDRVFEYTDGKQDWQDAGLPLETTAPGGKASTGGRR